MHGQGEQTYEHPHIGFNARMDTFQAAVLLAKLDIFEEELELRQKVARRYGELLADGPVRLPHISEGSRSAWAQYSVLAESAGQRQQLRDALGQAGVPSAVYYPKPLHLQSAFDRLGYRAGDFPVSEYTAERIFSLPMHPYLKPTEQEEVARALLGAGGN